MPIDNKHVLETAPKHSRNFEIGAGSVQQREPTSSTCAALDAVVRYGIFVGALQESGSAITVTWVIVLRFVRRID